MGSSDVPEPPLPLPAAAVDADVLLALIGRGSGVVAVAEVVLDDELADEPWFHIGENDVFPQEFLRFMGLPPTLQDIFVNKHGDLLDVAYWHDIQQRLASGELLSIIPYTDAQRLTRS